MERIARDFLVRDVIRHVLNTMMLIHAGEIEVANSGFIIDLSADIAQLRQVLAMYETELGSLQ